MYFQRALYVKVISDAFAEQYLLTIFFKEEILTFFYVLLLSQRFGHISVQGTVLEDELCGMGEHVICARWQCCACSDQLFCCCLACFGL